MDWIVERGVEKIPDGVSFERATLVEPLNTCLKAVAQCDPQPEDFVLVMGQGPIGLMFTMLVKRTGARVAATDTIAERLETAGRCGAEFAWNPRERDVAAEVKRLTEGRGADMVIVAASAKGIVESGDRQFAPRRADPVVRADFRHRADRSFRRRHLRG